MKTTTRVKPILPYVLVVVIVLTSGILGKNVKYWKSEKIITWDVVSYYGYLPATFIYQDISLKFTDDYTGPHKFVFWPRTLPNGNKLIMTSMGLSMVFAPFFFVAHWYALNSSFDAGGFSQPYQIAILVCAVFYFFIGLLVLSKLLLKFFKPIPATIALLFISAGTNLLYYVSYNPGMSHCYNFTLITIFLWFTVKWHERPKLKYAIFLGLIYGLITLIRPTNIVVGLFFVLYDITKFSDFKRKCLFFLSNYQHIILMGIFFLIIWIPQFLYWKAITGSFLSYSYGEENRFFFTHPRILKGLFSYRNGWLVYSPIMIFSVIGLFTTWKKNQNLRIPIIYTFLIFIYVIFSWWCWWYGGSFGNRAMIDIYGILAISLTAYLSNIFDLKIKWIRIPILVITFAFFIVGIHHLDKRMGNSLHYDSMTKESFWDHYLDRSPKATFWDKLKKPDYEKARQGIDAYVEE